MSIKEILSSDSNLSVTIKSTDLKEFADHIIKPVSYTHLTLPTTLDV